MFSKIFTFFLLLASFGIFTLANPISNDDLAVRSLLNGVPTELAEHLERRGGWPHRPCRKILYPL